MEIWYWLILVTLITLHHLFSLCLCALLSVFLSFFQNASLGHFWWCGTVPQRAKRGGVRDVQGFAWCMVYEVWGRGLGAEGHARTHTPEEEPPGIRCGARWTMGKQTEAPKGTQGYPKERTKLLNREEERPETVRVNESQAEEMGTSSTPGRPME